MSAAIHMMKPAATAATSATAAIVYFIQFNP
jgi:hypothetical protein